MAKKAVMVTLDEYTHSKAKELGINISDVADKALALKTRPLKSQAPDKALVLKCTECGKIDIKHGYFCQERDKFFCQKCQDNYNMALCPHDASGQHMHIRIPGLDGSNKDLIHRLPKNARE